MKRLTIGVNNLLSPIVYSDPCRLKIENGGLLHYSNSVLFVLHNEQLRRTLF